MNNSPALTKHKTNITPIVINHVGVGIQYPPNIPEGGYPVLAKIMTITELGKSEYHEVVYHNGDEWRSYVGSPTFSDGEQVLCWKYVDDCL